MAEMKRLWWRTDQWLLGVRIGGVAIKAELKGISLCSSRTVLSTMVVGYTNPNMCKNCQNYAHPPKKIGACKKNDEIQIRSIVQLMMLYQFQFPAFDDVLPLSDVIIGENWRKSKWKFSVFFAQLKGLIIADKFSWSVDK